MNVTLSHPALFRTQSLVDGAWVDAHDGSTYAVHNPYDRSVLAHVPDLAAADTHRAIAAAERAWQHWRTTTAGERAQHLRALHALMIKHADDLATLLTLEQGKPLAEARGEILYGASFIEWFAEEARRAYGDVIPGHAADKRIITIRQPVGVVAIITPWNFPNAMIARKLGAALAAGCTAVIKPAGNTPLSALALAQLAQEAGLPPGVVNVLTTDHPAEVGSALCASPLVRKLSFTGSTAVGKLLLRQCADTVKKVSLELGGNAPFIVFDDADLDAAVEGAVVSKFRNAGQTCVCANRLYVQAGVYDAFMARFKAAVATLKVGDGLAADVALGPVIDHRALQKIQGMLDDALAHGATLEQGGQVLEPGSTLLVPTILGGAHAGMRLAHEEVFGPVAPVFRFDTEAEVIALANDTDYGLAAYFYGRDIGRIWRVAEALEYGMVGINTGLISTAVAPFGGVKQSGMGREGSKYGLEDYMEVKYLCFGV